MRCCASAGARPIRAVVADQVRELEAKIHSGGLSNQEERKTVMKINELNKSKVQVKKIEARAAFLPAMPP